MSELKTARIEELRNKATGNEKHEIDNRIALMLTRRGEKICKKMTGWDIRRGGWKSPIYKYYTGPRGKRIAESLKKA